ncbi:MAG: hypothetical protein MMC23_008006 [Stictis urceolatum]|nr:hypothetical protein [Stictis urceolata]
MDLFSDFSFENATTSHRRTHYEDLDMEDISPSSSRSASPSASSLPEPNFSRRVSMAELAEQFDRQHLAHRQPAPLFGRLQTQSRPRLTSSPSMGEHYDTIRRRRASGARHLCSSTRLASIETLVDRMLKDGSSCYASFHPSSGRQGRRSDITSAPTSMPVSPTIGSEATSDGDSELEGMDEPAAPKSSKGSSMSVAAAKKRSGVEKPRRKVTPSRR